MRVLPFLLRDGITERAGSIDHTPFTVGRSPDRDLVLAHAYVSRRHAEIVYENERFFVVDRESRHGTYVRGQRVSRQAIGERETIHFGAPDGPSLSLGARPGSGAGSGAGSGVGRNPGTITGSGSAIHQILNRMPGSASISGLEKLRWFFESARKLNDYGAVDQILAVLLETTLQLTNVERGYVFLRSAEGELELALGRSSRGETLTDDGSLSRSAIEKARRTVSEYIVTDTLSEEAVAPSESIVAHNIRTVICIPLRQRRRSERASEGGLLGLLYLDNRLTAGNLTQIDSDLLRTIATEAAALIDNAQLAVAEQNERRYREELTIAAEIQQGLMAVTLPELPYAAIAARSAPCTQVGGDFYDVVADRESVSVVIADVSGKGISAAILASTLQGMIYAQLLARQPLDRIAAVVNHYICGKDIGKYATMAILRLRPDGSLEYINCGHIHPLVCPPACPPDCPPGIASSGPTGLSESNLPVGLIPGAVFAAAATRLEPGTRVLLTTDGVTEAENAEGEFFGEGRLHASIHPCASLDEIHRAMQEFCGSTPASDDCTMLEIVYRG